MAELTEWEKRGNAYVAKKWEQLTFDWEDLEDDDE
jgi:hypothetical protein